MKRIAPVAIIFILLGGFYYAYRDRGLSLHSAEQPRDVIRYSLQSDNVEDLRRYAPLLEAEMRKLPVVKDVRLDPQLKSEQAVMGADPQKPGVAIVKQLPTMTMTFSLVPNAALGEAIVQIREMQRRLVLPATINTTVAGGN